MTTQNPMDNFFCEVHRKQLGTILKECETCRTSFFVALENVPFLGGFLYTTTKGKIKSVKELRTAIEKYIASQPTATTPQI